MRKLLILLLVLVGAGALAAVVGGKADAPQAPPARSGQTASAVFAGGCFWCTEKDFEAMPGVISATSGYTGGRIANPTYDQVSAGNTGHIEAVRVVYDPTRIGYPELVARFFRTVDPFDAGGQFCDRGSQYAAAIFVATPQQRRVAERVKANIAQRLGRPVVTQILPAATFYPAEDYHQDYAGKNPIRYRYYRGSCGRDARLAEVWRG